MSQYSFAEFFSGGGMARAGLGDNWTCVFANDFDPRKCVSYRANWSSNHLLECDVADIPEAFLAKNIDLYWASSPCQDFSLAGKGSGLLGGKSSAFYPWIDKVESAIRAGFPPRIIAFENVVGLLSANQGNDFSEVFNRISKLGYRVGALILDAKNFLPQSRPRLFVIGVHKSAVLPTSLNSGSKDMHASQISKTYEALTFSQKQNWIWWNIDLPQTVDITLADIVETDVAKDKWFPKDKTQRLISLMNDLHLNKLKKACVENKQIIGTVYKRGRPNGSGKIVQRAELRLDGIAGCLRTPGGGSSRQTIMFINGNDIRARLLTSKEAARLMGLPDSYRLPEKYNDAYHLAGDGVAVPVVSYLTTHIFEPILNANSKRKAA